MKQKQAIDIVNNLDSKHEAAQPVLLKLVRKQKISNAEIDALDSRLASIALIIRDIRDGKASSKITAAINALDSRDESLKPLFYELVAGLTK